ncbi:MAG: tetratricopeptide repeat protein [Krumholzibacteria bacterium]|nr:tetratricopeptide repeat protein [Candidatus Krumholzibacteria bacterium]
MNCRSTLVMTVLLAVAAGCSPKAVQQDGTPAPADAARLIEHKVAAGETLALIADNYYGDPARAGQVAADNGVSDPRRLAVGAVLRLRFTDAEWAAARLRAAALEPYNQGVELMAAGRLAEAEDRFRLALATAPDLVSARYNLALVLVQRGQAEEALAILEDLTALRPEAQDLRFARGHALFAAGRFADATVQFRQVLAQDPAHRRAAFSLARALEEDGATAAAVAAWERYLVIDPDSSWADQARSRLRKLQDAG